MIAVRFSPKASGTTWAGATIFSDPMPEFGFIAFKPAFVGSGVIPSIKPLPLDKQAHICLLLIAFVG
jgi:hypothetical protein